MTQIEFTNIKELIGQLKPGLFVGTIRHDTFNGYNENGGYKYKDVEDTHREILFIKNRSIGVRHQLNTTETVSWLNCGQYSKIENNALKLFAPACGLFSSDAITYSATYTFFKVG